MDELKHVGIRTLVAAIQSGGGPSDALYEASEAVKSALTRSRDMLPAEEGALEQAFLVVCRRLKVRAVEEQLQRITRLLASIPGGTVELTEDSRQLLEERAALLKLKGDLLSPK
jgi:hypothetical protein